MLNCNSFCTHRQFICADCKSFNFEAPLVKAIIWYVQLVSSFDIHGKFDELINKVNRHYTVASKWMQIILPKFSRVNCYGLYFCIRELL